MGRPRWFPACLVALAFALSTAACGVSDPPAAPAGERVTGAEPGGEAAFPVTVEGTNGSLTIERRPERIVSLSATATEDLFAIGAGDQVVAVDEFSTYPPEAPITDLSGLEPNVEAIAGYEPDLVVYATETGDVGPSLEGLGIPALQLDAAAKLRDAFDQIEQLGLATGHVEEAGALVADLRAEVDEIVAGADPAAGLTFYYELDDTYYTVTSRTFIGQLFEMLGLENIADAASGAGPYPQLSAEFIIAADPDLIFLADTRCCGQSPDTVARRPGWDGIAAVRRDGVVPLDDDVASRWGPRVVELLRQIAEAARAAGERAT
jgi:iron complex transport system substrate-binding protein